MNEKLSFYMLVRNSEKYLDDILSRVSSIADEIILLDSGSNDQTESIAEKWGAIWHYREFDNFKNQRTHALSLCQNNWVLFLDADELPDDTLLDHIKLLKQTGFTVDAYTLHREWIVLGKPVRAVFPIQSPDFPTRLINKNKVSFDRSNVVHESYSGYDRQEVLPGKILHLTFHSLAEINYKLEFYTSLAAQDLLARGKKIRFYRLIFNPINAWFKWYIFKHGWKDGKVGIILGKYAFYYTYLKYQKTRSTYRSF